MTNIDKEFITLTQFLKMKDLISSGGEAKYFLKEKKVKVNGILEDRRGRKLFKDDEVYVEGKYYKID